MEPVTQPLPSATPDDRVGLPWRPFVVVLTGLGLFTALQLILAYRMKADLPLLEAFLSGLATWYPWLVLAPLVFRLCRHFRFDGGAWWRSALVRHVFVPLMVPLRTTDVGTARRLRRKSTKMSGIQAFT